MRELLLALVFAFLLPVSQVTAGLLSGAFVGWDNGTLKITNVKVGQEYYWGAFSYDPSRDVFYLVDYGVRTPSRKVRICYSWFSSMCNIPEIEFTETNGEVTGVIKLDDDTKVHITGTCRGGFCEFYDEKGCHFGVRYDNTGARFTMYLDGLSRFEFLEKCTEVTVLATMNQVGYRVITTEEDPTSDFDTQVDQSFEQSLPQNVVPGVVNIVGDLVCFGLESGFSKMKCYALDTNTMELIPFERNSEGNVFYVSSPEDLANYGAELSLPWVFFGPADQFQEKTYPLLADKTLFYVIRLRGCRDGNIVRVYVNGENGRENFAGYLDRFLNLHRDEPYTFETIQDGRKIYFQITTMEDPLPGGVLRELYKSGLRGFKLEAVCKDGTPTETQKFVIIF